MEPVLRAGAGHPDAGATAWPLRFRQQEGRSAQEVDAALCSVATCFCCSNRTRRRWKKQPIRSLLCRRPRKWQKSAPYPPPTSPSLRKALGSGLRGVGWGGPQQGMPSGGLSEGLVLWVELVGTQPCSGAVMTGDGSHLLQEPLCLGFIRERSHSSPSLSRSETWQRAAFACCVGRAML